MNYKKEYKDLWAWYNQKCDENNKAFSEALLRGEIQGLDCELDAQHREDTKEFNRRLDALRAKYVMESWPSNPNPDAQEEGTAAACAPRPAANR